MSTESEAELELAGRFIRQGFTDKQAKLMAVWQNPDIASICSQMPNLTVLMSNIAASLNKTRLSSEDLKLMNRFAMETSSSYCAGCANLCESAVDGGAPICDVMRYLMYYHSYGDRDRARTLLPVCRRPRRSGCRVSTLPLRRRCALRSFISEGS